jgi:hypothetical protein
VVWREIFQKETTEAYVRDLGRGFFGAIIMIPELRVRPKHDFYKYWEQAQENFEANFLRRPGNLLPQ